MSRKKEVFEVIDPEQQRAMEMTKELQEHSPRNQAIMLARIRSQDPKLAARIVQLMRLQPLPGSEKKSDDGDL
jgi:hypothetical protein